MKGVSIGVEFMGRILIAIFIVGVIIILLMTFLPDVFFGSFCRNGQAERINNMFADASSTRSHTIKSFVVESCVEYIDFTETKCTIGAHVGSIGTSRCYEVLYVGEDESNCADAGVACDKESLRSCIEDCGPRDVGLKCKDDCIASNCADDNYCSSHKGLFAPIPGGQLTFEITPYCDGSGCDGLRYKTGKYSVEIGPYSIKFLNPSS